ncbi:hypothetical protein TH60_17415 [Pantoea ananatis]|uniref:DUF1120 domain-containing protein n=1 Tax=Pantoea ananas TaxID=553 RepID=UPI000CF3CCF1|nr:DUF1120 domain-containing protein [Pantoea ananatis]PKC40429.1 membrane protein [Pantoea ananatis BRT98]MDC7871271.1 hypothetical protein [Pantoea ananatis]PQK74449.1 hypothetical protein CG428_13615 [Pantoea ananatis]PQK95417.1 hypothetical protein CG433_01075 [Pantoea ananatis]RQN03850.1 DUF1120 domain-containing protein [Pantoea ananatis]
MAISIFNVIFLTALSLSGFCRFFYTEIRKNNVSFNKTVLALSFTTSALFCHTAMAGTDINVHGIIAPNACTANVVGGEALDWGITQHEDLNQTELNTFAAKQVTLQVSCPSEQKVAFWATDPNASSALLGVNTNNRKGHADSTRIFGLGMDPVTGNKLGNFTISPVSSTVDGVTNTTSFGYQNGGAHNSTAFSRVLNADWSYKISEDWTPWNETTSAPASGKVISWVFDVEPQLNAGNMITNAQRVDWQGTAQINVRYF